MACPLLLCTPLAGSVLQRMPGLTEFLQWIDSRQLRRAAVTNAPRDNTHMMLAALQLGSYFEAVVLGEECERAKPHPDPYQQGLQLLGLQPHEAIVIEDSPAGAGRWVCCWRGDVVQPMQLVGCAYNGWWRGETAGDGRCGKGGVKHCGAHADTVQQPLGIAL